MRNISVICLISTFNIKHQTISTPSADQICFVANIAFVITVIRKLNDKVKKLKWEMTQLFKD